MKPPVLAKLMLAERFIPRLFDQIAAAAAAAPDGKCPDLAALEAAATAKEDDKPKPNRRSRPARTATRQSLRLSSK